METLGLNVSSFWGELSLFDPFVDLCIDFVEGALERGIDGAQGWQSERQSRAQDAIVSAREEQGHAQAELSDAIAEAAWKAFDQAVKTQASKLIGDGGL